MVGSCLEDFLQCPTIVFLSDKIKYNSSLQSYITFIFAPVIIVLLKPSEVSGSGRNSITGICAGRTFSNSLDDYGCSQIVENKQVRNRLTDSYPDSPFPDTNINPGSKII